MKGINLKERAGTILLISTSDDCDENITNKCHTLANVTPIVIAEEGLSSTKNKPAIANGIRCVMKNVTSFESPYYIKKSFKGDFFLEEWEDISSRVLINLINSIPRQFQAITKSKENFLLTREGDNRVDHDFDITLQVYKTTQNIRLVSFLDVAAHV